MYSYVIRLSFICTYPYVICMSLVCTRMLFVYHSYVTLCTRMSLVCHLYVTRMYSYVTRMCFYHEPLAGVKWLKLKQFGGKSSRWGYLNKRFKLFSGKIKFEACFRKISCRGYYNNYA